MKANLRLLTLLMVALLTSAQFSLGQPKVGVDVSSDGSDGALNITTNAVIDLSLASYGSWNQDNSTNAGRGVYDPTKWAVVFKYSSVTIASNCTVTFTNHPTHAPVVWLVQSNVTINGHLGLDGEGAVYGPPGNLLPTEPGPGGFRGGASSALGTGAGYGPGGGDTSSDGASYVGVYGNPQAMPLIGGSGNKGEGGVNRAGNAGGGALLLATGGTLTINGSVTALGATDSYGYYFTHYAYSASGAIRLVANSIQGNGSVTAAIVRTEANSSSPQLVLTPNTVIVPPGKTAVIWPSTNAPVVTVLSVNGISAPADPLAGVATSSDLSIATNNPVDIILQSQNFPPTGTIVVRVTPKYANYFNVNASYQSGTFSQSTWKATTTLPTGFCVIQAHATSP